MQRSTVVSFLAFLLLGGCSLLSNTRSTQGQLERVAKDWCQTIRASQVLCVYPLSEDLQVGDIYLVSTPIEDEVKEYRRRGFLPFQTLMTRLQPLGYKRMYLDAYRTKDSYHILPHQWQFPSEGTDPTAWMAAPHAAFPTYSFSVVRGQGLKLAVPVQAVPVGLSLMNSGKAHGSIEIADASTYGIDQHSIDQQVDAWASCPNVQALLARYEPKADEKGHLAKQQFLRVITRVYVTGRMNVTLQNDEQRGAGLDVGMTQAASVMTTNDQGNAAANAALNYANVISNLNASLNGTAPTPTPTGGAAASATPPTPAPATGAAPAPANAGPATPTLASPATPGPAAPPAPAMSAASNPDTPDPAPVTPATPVAPATPSPDTSTPAVPGAPAVSVPGPASPTAPAPAAVIGASLPKPGGSIRIAAASSRGITMSETFDRPIVVGYIAYDRPIEHGGMLGASTATLLRVEQRPAPAPRAVPSDNIKMRASFGPDQNTPLMRAWLANRENGRTLQNWLDDQHIGTPIPLIVSGDGFAPLRQRIVSAFGLGGICGTN